MGASGLKILMPAPEPGTVGTIDTKTCELPISYMKILLVYLTPLVILLALTRRRLSNFWLVIAAHAICVHMGWYQKIFSRIGIETSEISFGAVEALQIGKKLLSKAAKSLFDGWFN